MSRYYLQGHTAGLDAGFKNGYEIGFRDGKRDAVQSGELPRRDSSGEADIHGGPTNDPTAGPDPEKGLDESPEDEVKTEGGSAIAWRIKRTLATVQERYGLGRVLHTIYMAQEDLQQLFNEMDDPHYRETDWTPAVIWWFNPWKIWVEVDCHMKPGELRLCFRTNVPNETHTAKTTF